MSHKPPAERAHLWERPARADEQEPAPIDRDFPRHVHKADGEFLEVTNPADLEIALAAGWLLEPPVTQA